MRPPQPSTGSASANPGYALGQLARALATAENDERPDVRARAAQKAETWVRVFEGMLSGVLRIGSSTPLADTPAWVTLEVVQGGFATGALLASGPLQPHEEEVLRRLPVVPPGTERAALNAYYLGEEGLAELRRMLASGCCRIHVPEEGALLVVVWLLEQGHTDQARELLDEIAPFLSRLRFYPVPDNQPLLATPVVHLQDVARTVQDLKSIRPSERIERQKEAILVWAPLYDRVVALFLETIEGPIPTLRSDAKGKVLRDEKGRFLIEGGWPCQHYPDGWREKALAVLEDYRRLREQHQLCSAPESRNAGFPTLRRYLKMCLTSPQQLTGRDVGLIRSILAGLAAKGGLPGESGWQDKQERQARQAAAPTSADIASVLMARLDGRPRDQGLASLDAVLAPVVPEEAAQFNVPAGASVPPTLVRKVRRCLDAPVEVLVELGVVPSAEVLARVVPQITSQVRAAEITDPDLRRLYGALYSAFRCRRSLLLLNLQRQVRLEDLPWVRVINAHRTGSLQLREQARQAFEHLALLAVTAFPQQILPNKLLQEMRSLAEGAELRIPLVDEVAADIFMGEFSEKFLRAAQKAGELLEGTLYERYYGLPYARVRQMDDVTASRFGTPTSAGFARLCRELGGDASVGRNWSVAANGKVIEQEQILTTHNLAVLFDALGLAQPLRPRLAELASRCFRWICRRQQKKITAWKPRLRMVKNTAYAWRQMVFWLALLSAEEVETFLKFAAGHLREQDAAFRARFQPALDGLIRAAKGLPVEEGEARRFLGWTTEKHWLLA
jgi:hypothetical protein